MSVQLLGAYCRAALQHRHPTDTVEVHGGARNAMGRRITLRQFDAEGALDVEMVGKMVVSRRRRLFGRTLDRIRHALGWHTRRQKLATNAFIAALHAHARDSGRVEEVLKQEGVRRNRALTARQLLRVVTRFEPEVEQRMEYSHLDLDSSLAPRRWHYAQRIVMKLKRLLRP
jgi:hypothetical protein